MTNSDDRIRIFGATLTKRGERVLVWTVLLAFLLLMAFVGKVELQ